MHRFCYKKMFSLRSIYNFASFFSANPSFNRAFSQTKIDLNNRQMHLELPIVIVVVSLYFLSVAYSVFLEAKLLYKPMSSTHYSHSGV